jgi:hypothetical protein
MYALREPLLMLFNYRISYHACLFLKLLLEDMRLSASLHTKTPNISSIRNTAVQHILRTIDLNLIFLPCFSAMMDHLYGKTELSQV